MSNPGTPEPDSRPTRSYPAVDDDARTPPTLPPATPTEAAGTPDPMRFQPIRLHKEGGMGRVHLALDAELNRHVAFKEILPDLADIPAVVDHFLFEAEVM